MDSEAPHEEGLGGEAYDALGMDGRARRVAQQPPLDDVPP